MMKRNINCASPYYECGWLFRPGSMWIGVHYSRYNRRWCINLLPCVTLWVTKPGGRMP